MKFDNFLKSGNVFTKDEYELENKFILGNALLLAISVNMFVCVIIMYFTDFHRYLIIYSVTVLISLLLILLLRLIKKENLDIFGYIVFFCYMILLFYTYSLFPSDFPVTSWFAILIIPSLIIHGHRFAFTLSIIYFALLWFFYGKFFGNANLEMLLTEFPPLILTIWFVYFYHQRYRDSLKVIEEKHAYMLHQSRLASMGEMIENIAHQWRQPLSQINSSVLLLDGILKQKGVEDSRIEEKLLEIESLTQYMSHTINDFQNFFEEEKDSIDFTIKEVLTHVHSLTKMRLKKEAIQITYSGDVIPTLNGFPNELQQVLLVVINNAIDSLANNEIVNPEILVKVKTLESNIQIAIEDNAGGIDESILDKIFNPYFSTKKESNGRGLGLYMSKMIIEDSMQGILLAYNSEKGACFVIEIPKRLRNYD